MRAEQFLKFLNNEYNSEVATELATNTNIKGGWEVWLQLEIALTFVNQGGHRTSICDREAYYPSGQPAPNIWIGKNPAAPPAYIASSKKGIRCDFYLHRPGAIGIKDETYIELKCINPTVSNPLDDAWNRFDNDIKKIENILRINGSINAIASLATFGCFDDPLPSFPARMTAYVWDPYNDQVTSIANVEKGGNERFFIVAVSV